jgi:hypothetical protein
MDKKLSQMSFDELIKERQTAKNLMETCLNKYQTSQQRYHLINEHIIQMCTHDFSNGSHFCKKCGIYDSIMYRS